MRNKAVAELWDIQESDFGKGGEPGNGKHGQMGMKSRYLLKPEVFIVRPLLVWGWGV